MSKSDLPAVNLHNYAETIRDVFGIYDVPDDVIDYTAIQAIPTEIQRRRALLQHFIPDVFESTKYDRRADIIDGCIYYLELVQGTGNDGLIWRLWSKRTNIPISIQDADWEEDPYGYFFYHPIFCIIGREPTVTIPKLIQKIRAFKDRRRKLSLKDYYLIAFPFLFSTHSITLNEKTVSIIQKLLNHLQQPLNEGIRFREFIEKQDMKNSKKLAADVKSSIAQIRALYERSVFGLVGYLFECPFPYHVHVNAQKPPVPQNFMMSGSHFIQQVYTVIPENANWRHLYVKFPPQTRCYRQTKLRLPFFHTFDYYDFEKADWNWPWGKIKDNLQLFLNTLEMTNDPVQVNYGTLEPNADLVRICYHLEQDSNLRNSMLSRITKIPRDRTKELRELLEKTALAQRSIVLHSKSWNDITRIVIPGKEDWKYRVLLKISEAALYCQIMLLDDLVEDTSFLRGLYWLPSKDNPDFLKTIAEVFDGVIDYHIYHLYFPTHIPRPWYTLFDSETDTWEWDSKDYNIIPLKFPVI